MLNNIQPLLNNPYILVVILFWSVLWKGMALWRAARLKHVGWFVALLLINTLGIFEIIYLLATNKKYKETNGCVS